MSLFRRRPQPVASSDPARHVEVRYAAVRDAVCVLDGLAEALGVVERRVGSGFGTKAEHLREQIAELRTGLLPDAPTGGPEWARETYDAGREWYTDLAFAFRKSVSRG